jgi:signal transduction histidine kinase
VAIVSDQTWLIVIVTIEEGTYKTNLAFVILAGILLFVLCVSLDLFLYGNILRLHKLQELKAQTQTDRAMLVLENARQSARAERELNDFLEHEVRNPLSAAMSACSFVAAAVERESNGTIIITAEERQSVKDDLEIMDESLTFINDLLQSMLDMHWASSKQLQLQLHPTHLMNNVLRPVDSMLHRRGANYQVLLECNPDHLVLLADPLCLKQILLNLARNLAKFVEQGFIRLTASISKQNNNGTIGRVQLTSVVVFPCLSCVPIVPFSSLQGCCVQAIGW